MFKRYTALSVIIVIQTALAILIGGAFMSVSSVGKVIPGIYSAGVALGGMTPEKAEEALRERLAGVDKEVLILEGQGRQWSIPMADLGAFYDYREAVKSAYSIGHSGSLARRISELLGNRTEDIEVPVPVRFDPEALKRELDKVNSQYSKPPKNARIILLGDKEVKLISSEDGQELDLEGTKKQILNLKAGMFPRVVIVSKPVFPQISEKDISGLTDVLGQCTTRFDAESPGRASNIARAAGLLDGTLVKAGETFSFNKSVSLLNGQGDFEKAPVIVDDQLVDDFGGGICQVTTTLYGAVLLSGLEIVERSPHSKPVKYVPPGLDATVADGLIDFRFRNNFGEPVYIISSDESEDGSVKITILGKRKENTIYKLDSQVKIIPPGIVMKSSPWLMPGQSVTAREGSPGFEVSVYRVVVFEGGSEKKELISDDFYPPDPKVVEVGLTSGR